jgi:hypothetical protein
MNKIINLLLAISIAHISISQSIFESDLSSWSGGVPTDWMGASTNISSNDVHELTDAVNSCTSFEEILVEAPIQSVGTPPDQELKSLSNIDCEMLICAIEIASKRLIILFMI